MAIVSGICSVPDMARVWSSRISDKAALIDGDRVVTDGADKLQPHAKVEIAVAGGRGAGGGGGGGPRKGGAPRP